MHTKEKTNNYENTANAPQKETEHKERLCKIYGACGIGSSQQNPHQISHFGLKKLNENKN